MNNEGDLRSQREAVGEGKRKFWEFLEVNHQVLVTLTFGKIPSPSDINAYIFPGDTILPSDQMNMTGQEPVHNRVDWGTADLIVSGVAFGRFVPKLRDRVFPLYNLSLIVVKKHDEKPHRVMYDPDFLPPNNISEVTKREVLFAQTLDTIRQENGARVAVAPMWSASEDSPWLTTIGSMLKGLKVFEQIRPNNPVAEVNFVIPREYSPRYDHIGTQFEQLVREISYNQ